MIRVLVAAESERARAGLEALLARIDSLAVVGSSTVAAALAARAREARPDVIVLESAAFDEAAFEEDTLAARLGEVSGLAGGIPLVVLGDDAWRWSPAELLHAGVRAVLSHDATAEEIGAAVGAAAAGLVALDSAAFEALLAPGGRTAASSPTGAAHSSAASALTPREIEVLSAVAEGLGNKQIATRLRITEHTVKAHLAAVFDKLDASSRTQAVMAGARLGLIPL